MKRLVAVVMSLVILTSCGYSSFDSSSVDTSAEDVVAAIVPVDEIPESSETVSSQEPSSSETPSSSEAPSSSEEPSSKAESSKVASSKAKVTTVTGDNDYTAVTDGITEDIEDNKSYTVYITDTGEKYHSSGCRHLSKSKHAISRDDARAQGYEPCKVCKPG